MSVLRRISPTKRAAWPKRILWPLSLLALGWAPAGLAQGVNPNTPTPPDATRPGPEPTTPHGVDHPAPPSTNANATGLLPGSDKPQENQGLTFLPYFDEPQGSASLPTLHSGTAQLNAEAHADNTQPLVLDRVAAVINGDVILESDVTEEQHFAVFEPYSVPGGQFTPLQAMQHIVSRTLILQQMNEQQIVTPPTDAEVAAELTELRAHIPACAEYGCTTAAGWHKFLVAHGFNEASIEARWKQRMTILRFIEIRFRSGIRISQTEIEDYYKKNLIPEYAKRKMPAPPLATVSKRIDQVLLQQHVNVLLQDWLKSLRDAGSVSFLDPAYASVGTASTTPTTIKSGGSGTETSGGTK